MGYEAYYGLRADGMTEESRGRYRREIRSALDFIEIEKLHVGEFEAVIAAANADSELAAEEHSLVCQPAQAALKESDEKSLDAIRAKKPIPPEVSAARVEALKAVAAANSALESRIQANRATTKSMKSQIDAARMNVIGQGPLEGALINLADASLRDQFSRIGGRLEWSRHRHTHAQQNVAMQTRILEAERSHRHPDVRHIATYLERIQGHQHMADDASEQVAELTRELADLRFRMLDE